MLIVEINEVGSQSLQGALDRTANIFRRSIHDTPHLPVGCWFRADAEFSRNHGLVTLAEQSLTQQLLVGIWPVHLGRVQECAPKLERAVQRQFGFPFVSRAIKR
jgi:hypothetical protein